MNPDVIAPANSPMIGSEVAVFLASSLSGAFGAVVASINVCNRNMVRFPFFNRKVQLGIIGDALIGAAAAVAVLLLIASAPGARVGDSMFRIIPLGILSGVAGSRLLQGMSNAVLGKVLSEQEKLETRVDQMGRVAEIISEGERLLSSNLKAAEELFHRALAIDPHHPVAHLDLGKSFRHQAEIKSGAEKEKLMANAIAELTLAIETSPRYDRAYYNRACYKALSEKPLTSVLEDLKKAIDLFPGNKEIAAKDPDFAKYWNNPLFSQLVGEGSG